MTRPNYKQAIVAALPATTVEIMAAASCSQMVVLKWITRLRAEPLGTGAHVYLKRWKRTGGRRAPVWAVGDVPDAPMPARLTDAAYSRRAYKKRKIVEDEIRANRKAARANAKVMSKRRDPLVGALFGAPA